MRKESPEPLPPHLVAEVGVLEAMSDDEIDFTDIPPTTDFSGAVRGRPAGARIPDRPEAQGPRRITLPEPVARIYGAVAELERTYQGRKFTPDGHLVGSIGEVIAAEALGLTLYPMGRPGHDARDSEGRDVQIKLTAGTSVAMYAESVRLVVLRVVSVHEAEIVYDGPGAPAWAKASKRAKNGQRVVSLAALRRIAAEAAA